MRYTFVFVLCFVVLQGLAQTNQKEIRTVLANQQQAWNNGDIQAFMQGYWNNDSLRFIGKKGITYGWKPTYENYLKSYPDRATMGTLSFEILSIAVLSNESAYVIGKWNLTREASKGDIGGHFTLLFKKIQKRWVIVCDHTS